MNNNTTVIAVVSTETALLRQYELKVLLDTDTDGEGPQARHAATRVALGSLDIQVLLDGSVAELGGAQVGHQHRQCGVNILLGLDYPVGRLEEAAHEGHVVHRRVLLHIRLLLVSVVAGLSPSHQLLFPEHQTVVDLVDERHFVLLMDKRTVRVSFLVRLLFAAFDVAGHQGTGGVDVEIHFLLAGGNRCWGCRIGLQRNRDRSTVEVNVEYLTLRGQAPLGNNGTQQFAINFRATGVVHVEQILICGSIGGLAPRRKEAPHQRIVDVLLIGVEMRSFLNAGTPQHLSKVFVLLATTNEILNIDVRDLVVNFALVEPHPHILLLILRRCRPLVHSIIIRPAHFIHGHSGRCVDIGVRLNFLRNYKINTIVQE
jgi:hypothetical protein